MKHLLLDTNAYSAFKGGAPDVVDTLRYADRLLMCSVVVGELHCGFRCGTRYRQNVEELEKFLNTPRVYVLGTDETTAEYYGRIYQALRSKGQPIPTNDMWIAACALQQGAALCSLDEHFANIDGLLLVTPGR